MNVLVAVFLSMYTIYWERANYDKVITTVTEEMDAGERDAARMRRRFSVSMRHSGGGEDQSPAQSNRSSSGGEGDFQVWRGGDGGGGGGGGGGGARPAKGRALSRRLAHGLRAFGKRVSRTAQRVVPATVRRAVARVAATTPRYRFGGSMRRYTSGGGGGADGKKPEKREEAVCAVAACRRLLPRYACGLYRAERGCAMCLRSCCLSCCPFRLEPRLHHDGATKASGGYEPTPICVQCYDKLLDRWTDDEMLVGMACLFAEDDAEEEEAEAQAERVLAASAHEAEGILGGDGPGGGGGGGGGDTERSGGGGDADDGGDEDADARGTKLLVDQEALAAAKTKEAELFLADVEAYEKEVNAGEEKLQELAEAVGADGLNREDAVDAIELQKQAGLSDEQLQKLLAEKSGTARIGKSRRPSNVTAAAAEEGKEQEEGEASQSAPDAEQPDSEEQRSGDAEAAAPAAEESEEPPTAGGGLGGGGGGSLMAVFTPPDAPAAEEEAAGGGSRRDSEEEGRVE